MGTRSIAQAESSTSRPAPKRNRREYHRAWRSKNRERRKDQAREWRERQGDRLTEYQQEHYQKRKAARPTEAAYWPRLKKSLMSRFGATLVIGKTWGGPYGVSGLPDAIGCLRGYFVGIELKRWSAKDATAKQVAMLNSIYLAGGVAMVVVTSANPENVAAALDTEVRKREQLRVLA